MKSVVSETDYVLTPILSRISVIDVVAFQARAYSRAIAKGEVAELVLVDLVVFDDLPSLEEDLPDVLYLPVIDVSGVPSFCSVQARQLSLSDTYFPASLF